MRDDSIVIRVFFLSVFSPDDVNGRGRESGIQLPPDCIRRNLGVSLSAQLSRVGDRVLDRHSERIRGSSDFFQPLHGLRNPPSGLFNRQSIPGVFAFQISDEIQFSIALLSAVVRLLLPRH